MNSTAHDGEFDSPYLPGKWRTARKEYRCRTCHCTIQPGDRHFEYLGAGHAYESGERYCKPCATTEWLPYVRMMAKR